MSATHVVATVRLSPTFRRASKMSSWLRLVAVAPTCRTWQHVCFREQHVRATCRPLQHLAPTCRSRQHSAYMLLTPTCCFNLCPRLLVFISRFKGWSILVLEICRQNLPNTAKQIINSGGKCLFWQKVNYQAFDFGVMTLAKIGAMATYWRHMTDRKLAIYDTSRTTTCRVLWPPTRCSKCCRGATCWSERLSHHVSQTYAAWYALMCIDLH